MAYHSFAEFPRPPSFPRFSSHRVFEVFSYTRYFQLIQLTPLRSLLLSFTSARTAPFPSNLSRFLFSHSLRVARCRFISSSFFLNFFSLPFTISLAALPPAPTPACPKPVSSLPCSHSFTRPLFFFFRVLSHHFLYIHRTISCTCQTAAYLPHLFQAHISVAVV